MRTELKVGLAFVLIIGVGATVYWARFAGKPEEVIPFNKSAVDAKDGLNLAGDASPSGAKKPAAGHEPAKAPSRDSPLAHKPPVEPAPRIERPKPPTQEPAPIISPNPAENVIPPPTRRPDTQPADSGLTRSTEAPPSSPTATPLTREPASERASPPPQENGAPAPSATTRPAFPAATDAPAVHVPTRRTEGADPATPGASPASPRPSGPRRTHVVQAGETLIQIAEDYFKDASRWRAIKAANPGVDETKLSVGQQLVIPQASELEELLKTNNKPAANAPRVPPTTQPATASGARPPASDRATYVVGKGDTLIKIARDVLGDQSRWREIYELNKDKLSAPDDLQTGVELKLPARKKP